MNKGKQQMPLFRGLAALAATDKETKNDLWR
jgi:hypothetical protein